eukprot:1104306-Amphidinium_carterae.1
MLNTQFLRRTFRGFCENNGLNSMLYKYMDRWNYEATVRDRRQWDRTRSQTGNGTPQMEQTRASSVQWTAHLNA